MPTFTKRYLFWTALLTGILCGSGISYSQTITGTVYRDFNSDGVASLSAVATSGPGGGTANYTEVGMPNVLIQATPVSGPIVSATTTALGTYTLNLAGTTGPYRVEFLGFLGNGDFESFAGTGSRTSVQFVTAGATGVNFGINYPAHYCGPVNPDGAAAGFLGIRAATSCFVNGDNTSSGVTNEPTIVSFPFNSGGNQTGTNPRKDALAPTVGTVWGLAYQRSSEKLFTSAFVRRHTGVIGDDYGAIYVSDYSASTVTTTKFLSLSSLGISTINPNDPLVSRGLPSGPTSLTSPSADAWGFRNVGRSGIGDMIFSDDEQTLYFTNLGDRKLYALSVGVPAVAPTNTSQVKSFSIVPSGVCLNNDHVIFATKFYRGKVYVGAVCTGQSSITTAAGSLTNVQAMVYEFNPQTEAVSQVISFPLTFQRGFASDVYATCSDPNSSCFWKPWTDNFSLFLQSAQFSGSRITTYPQPMLSNIEFDVDGSMILAFADRGSLQLGTRNFSPGGTGDFTGINGGDLLRVGYRNGIYQLESNGVAVSDYSPTGSFTSLAGVGNSDGPGGGEFYFDDRYQAGFVPHEETAIGSVVNYPGAGQVLATVIDPTTLWSGGVSRFSNRNGSAGATNQTSDQTGTYPANRFRVYGDGSLNRNSLGKAAGLGDIELLCGIPPIMIGNRVWRDDNDNGIQDPNEAPLSGVEVTLKGPGLPQAGVTVTTNSNGEYYFTNATSTSFASGTTGIAASLSLTYGGSYSLCFPTSASAGALSLSTKPNSATGNNEDRIDTDPNQAGVIAFTLGAAGENNFSYDAAFVELPCALSVSATPACDPATNLYTLTGTVSLTGNTLPSTLTIVSNGASTTLSAAASQSAVSYTLTGSSLVSNGPATQTLTVTSSATACGVASVTYTVPANCILTPACLITATASANSSTIAQGGTATFTAIVSPTDSYTYAWAAPDGITLTSPDAATTGTSALPSGVHTFTVVATSTGGCSTTATVCVSVPFTACQGSDYAFELSTTPGYDTYEWVYTAPGSATSSVVQSGTANTYLATQAGEYSVQAFRDGLASCPDGSCCPAIISEIPTPVAPSLTAVAATCNSQTATVANNDAQLVLSGTALSGLTYNIVKGNSYTAAAPLFGSNQALPTTAGSVLAQGLVNPVSSAGDTYTVRIFQGECFVDVVVVVPQTVCGCPPPKCVPFVIQKVQHNGGGTVPLNTPSGGR